MTIVCCGTTKGVINIAVHLSWAPRGATRFLEMVKSGFFESQVPLFRALKDFLIQFGLAGTDSISCIMFLAVMWNTYALYSYYNTTIIHVLYVNAIIYCR